GITFFGIVDEGAEHADPWACPRSCYCLLGAHADNLLRRVRDHAPDRVSVLAGSTSVRARNQHWVLDRILLVGGSHRVGHDLVVGREVADRVGARRVAGERERLAAAAPEVDLPT